MRLSIPLPRNELRETAASAIVASLGRASGMLRSREVNGGSVATKRMQWKF